MKYEDRESVFPRVSIVAVNYNGLQWFKLFLADLVTTEYPDFEIIIVDNASTDESVQFIKDNFKQVRILELDENKGFAHGINMGVTEATGDILAFINNDMQVERHWLRYAVIKLVSSESIGAVQCKTLFYNDRSKIDCVGLSVDHCNIVLTIGHNEIDEGQYDNLQEIGACSGGAMIIWKKIFEDVGRFDPVYFMYYEDIDLSWRIRSKGFRIRPAQSSIIYHVGSATSNVQGPSGKWSLSPFFAFHITKNYTYCWLKNSSRKIILEYWPIIAIIVLTRAIFELFNGRPPVALAHIKGIFWNLRHVKLILNKRKMIQKLRTIKLDDSLRTSEVRYSSNLVFWIKNGLQIAKRSINAR